MSRRYLPVKAAMLAAAGILLTGAGVAVAAPDSNSDKGGGKPSSAASVDTGSKSGNSGSAPGNSGSAPGKTGSAPDNSGSAPGKPASTPGESGQKYLPKVASPVAVAATIKTNLAAASSKAVEAPSATGIPTVISAQLTGPVTVSVNVTIAPVAPGPNRGSAPAHAVRPTAAPPAAPLPAGPSARATPEPHPRHSAAPAPTTAAPAAAALAVSAPQSTGGTPAPAPAPTPSTQRSWLGQVSGHVADEVRAALREVTLEELATAALPGLAGILFCLFTGIGLGHRQAKFCFALQSTGALRFAFRGPPGVLRPGGFISVPGRIGKARSNRQLISVAVPDRAA